MKHGSLFSGIGGFDLASEWMGWDNVFHCEWNEFGKRVLNYYSIPSFLAFSRIASSMTPDIDKPNFKDNSLRSESAFSDKVKDVFFLPIVDFAVYMRYIYGTNIQNKIYLSSMEGSKKSKAEVSRENLKKAISARVAKGRTERVCQGCGKLCSIHMAAVRKGWKYCSLECRYKTMVGSKGANAGGGAWMVGENNVNFKHGLSSERLPRDLTKVNRWRRRVFERDKYTCQKCGYDKGKILRAHHIATWADFPELRYELSNGITLCDKCHRWVHSKKNINKDLLLCK